MSRTLTDYLARYKSETEEELHKNLPLSNQRFAARLNDALLYAVFPGGKRWRPVLTLLAGQLVGATEKSLFPTACAMEYLHTSSMILDDLPCMDDADLRRGKLALHLAFDESTALLAALALMNHSYALLAQTCEMVGRPEQTGQLIALATSCIGADGMIGGQVVDMEVVSTHQGPAELKSRNLKTTALMRMMMTAGAVALGTPATTQQALAEYGEALGAAYQICDDLLDETGTQEFLGKPSGQDQRHLRPTFAREYGPQAAHRMAAEIIKSGLTSLRKEFGKCQEVALLAEAATLIVGRQSQFTKNCSYEVLSVL